MRKDDEEKGQDVKLTEVTVSLPVSVRNPWLVYGEDDRLLGSAVVTPGPDRLYVHFILDPHNPESFDLASEPSRCTVDVRAVLEGGELRGHVRLISK